MARIGGRRRASSEGEEKNGVYVQALARGLTILSMFDVEHTEWSLGDISRHTGITKTTAYRMLRTLEHKGFVTFDPDTELYNIGPSTVPIAYLTLSYVNFSRLMRPILEKLADITGETVELAVESGGGAVILEQVATSNTFKPRLPIGRVLRNLANSAMKLFAAYMPEEDRERLINEYHVAMTPYTVTDPELIRAELDRVAETGISFDLEEHNLGVCAVSAPVVGSDGKVEAVIALVAPAERFGPENRKRYAEAAKAAAAEMSAYLSQSAAPLIML